MGKIHNALKKSIVLTALLGLMSFSVLAQQSAKYPFATDSTSLTIWNGSEYIPFFIKGINLGVAVPGTFPGEMAATRTDYDRWLKEIKDAGFNCIRIYTLHYPRFFEALDAFNKANPQNPLLFIQGVWLEEELSGYSNDLYYLSNAFKKEIEENIDCVHGKKVILPRVGKAYGTYTTDASRWCLGYIIGREVYPVEVQTTDLLNSAIDKYVGNYFSIMNASASEAWLTSMLDHAVSYEQSNYKTQRPISASSWPTLDPLAHAEEVNRDEDMAQIDLSKIELTDACKGGFFASYHAYPYYPDFVSQQTSYQTYSDNYGPNSYMGYLTDLKSHYKKYPLIIAEYGVPSSWAIAHYSTSGMNHGGFDTYNQGLTDIRLLNTIKNTSCGGGIQFSWMDEWFKKTWIADPIDYIADSRILWQNLASAEQNFGLVSFDGTLQKDTLIKHNTTEAISYVNTQINFSSYELEIGLKNPLDIPDELWIALDTYSKDLGESILPSGATIPTRAEFALQITNYSAKLYVTQAYDLFGIWHKSSDALQKYHSISTNGAPWNIVRVRNNSSHSDVQYIGDLQVNYDFQPASSKDAVTISDDKIVVKIPWSYINVVSPDQMKVFNDNRNTVAKEDTISDGFVASVRYKNKWYTPSTRYKWNPWTNVKEYTSNESLKTSYYVMQDNLSKFNTPAIAVRDSFTFEGPSFPVSINASEGLLNNDFDLDGNTMISLITDNPVNGQIYLDNDGSFTYLPNLGFTGIDSLRYCVYDGNTLSKPDIVYLTVNRNIADIETTLPNPGELILSPNPCSDYLVIKSQTTMDMLEIFQLNGQLVERIALNEKDRQIDVSNYATGSYIVVVRTNGKVISEQFIKH